MEDKFIFSMAILSQFDIKGVFERNYLFKAKAKLLNEGINFLK